MKIAFPAGTLSYRGTHVAIYDYAYHNQSLLGNESIVYIDENNPGPLDLVNKFQKEFECVFVQNWSDLSNRCLTAHCDAAYILKSGERDHQNIAELPNLVHAVFPQPVSEAHGSVYAFVSEWLSKECSNNRLPYVPHMIQLPDIDSNLRQYLNIPNQATVFGYYGGYESFDIDFVKNVVVDICDKKNIWFLFMNVQPFSNHKNIIHLQATSDPVKKRQFINTCDAMLHARGMGESFGLACGEFSLSNRPVITYGLSPQRAHLHMLGDKAFIYKGPSELKKILTEFDRDWSADQKWDVYSSTYNADSVMRKFAEVFLNENNWSQSEMGWDLDFEDHIAVEFSHLKRRLRSRSRKYHNYFS